MKVIPRVLSWEGQVERQGAQVCPYGCFSPVGYPGDPGGDVNNGCKTEKKAEG